MSKNKTKARAAKAAKKVAKAPATEPTDEELWKGVQQNHDEHEKARDSMAVTIRACIGYVLLAGQLLATIKSRLKHGEFEKAVAANCTLSIREVQRYMQLFLSQAILDAIDKDWRQKFTLVEALEAVREYGVANAVAAIDEQRTSQAESREKASKMKSKPTAKAAARSKRSTGKAPTTSAVRSAFKVAHQELGNFHNCIEVIKRPETLKLIEDEAARFAKECQTLISECKQQRAALKKSLKAKAIVQTSLKPTAKSVRDKPKRQKSANRSETEPMKA